MDRLLKAQGQAVEVEGNLYLKVDEIVVTNDEHGTLRVSLCKTGQEIVTLDSGVAVGEGSQVQVKGFDALVRVNIV